LFLCNCMVKIREIKNRASEENEDVIEDIIEEVEGGIFDEDFEEFDEEDLAEPVNNFEEIDEEAPASDFDIGSTMLSISAPVESWSGQNLEDTLSRERVEKDWSDDEDAFAGDFYKSSAGGDVYGVVGNDVYSSGGGRGNDVYSEGGSGGTYDSGKDGNYSSTPGDVGSLKSHEEVKDNRRGGSMLESMGFEDKGKKKHDEFTREFVALGDKDAA